MKKSTIRCFATSAMLLSTSFAAAKSVVLDTFVHKPSGYEVTVLSAKMNGRTIKGVHPVTGETFTMNVTASGLVTGDYAGKPVRMTVDDARRNVAARALATRLAAKTGTSMAGN
jgi:hypothetical protein